MKVNTCEIEKKHIRGETNQSKGIINVEKLLKEMCNKFLGDFFRKEIKEF